MPLRSTDWLKKEFLKGRNGFSAYENTLKNNLSNGNNMPLCLFLTLILLKSVETKSLSLVCGVQCEIQTANVQVNREISVICKCIWRPVSSKNLLICIAMYLMTTVSSSRRMDLERIFIKKSTNIKDVRLLLLICLVSKR